MRTEALSLLLPPPQEALVLEGYVTLPDPLPVELAAPASDAIWQQLTRGLEAVDMRPTRGSGKELALHLEIQPDVGVSQSYRLQVDAEGIRIQGADAAGLSYGVATLLQWLLLHASPGRMRVPALRVIDQPSFQHRGVMLDISRDKVPKLETLRELVDLFAGWKINQLQLYMEHTFAYRGHEIVWRDASPLTAGEVRELGSYCRSRGVELVPNQNSFGHFHRWLVHEPYRRLAESPEGIEHPFSPVREPFSLCPIDPGSLDLLAELYDQLLPCFSSELFNVGLDETFDLGFGRSAERCAELGKGRVYLQFLQQVEKMVRDRGRRMQFWGDVILNDPELLSELPRRAIALEWGYEADHPFARDTRLFRDSGLDFYVCPGTSSWNSFAGRVDNAVRNLASAAVHGHARGALGYLVTDWGDNGHLQPLPVSYPGWVAGAAFGWNAGAGREPHELPLARLLDRHVYRDTAGVMGELSCDLGNVYQVTGARAQNGSALFFALVFAHKQVDERRGEGMTQAGLGQALDQLAAVADRLPQAGMDRADDGLIRDELSWVAEASGLGAKLASARLDLGDTAPVNALPGTVRSRLGNELEGLIERHRQNWLARNRPGGLEGSVARLSRVRDLLA
ncbi:MAG: family 20 glycosylhydrolase [Acidobacteriota bacterium]